MGASNAGERMGAEGEWRRRECHTKETARRRPENREAQFNGQGLMEVALEGGLSGLSAEGKPVPGTKTAAEVITDLQDETTRGKISWAAFCEAAAKLTPDELARQLWNALLECARLRQSSAPATPLPHPRPKRSRKRLRTPRQVVREIRDTISDLSSGQLDSGTARTKLYALQTLLCSHEDDRIRARKRPEIAA